MRNFINFLIVLRICTLVQAQEFAMPSDLDKVEIPVDVVSGIMIAKAKVNGTELRFIIDSGASRSTIFNINGVDSLNVGQGRETTIRGYGSLEPFKAVESFGNLIQIEELTSANATVNILTESQISFLPILGTEVNGILGIDFFKNHLVELDYRKEKVIFHRAREKIRLSRYDTHKLMIDSGKMFIEGYVSEDKQGMNVNLLVDTGSGDALWLFEKAEKFKLPKKGFKDYLGFGMSGDVYGFRSKVSSLTLGNFLFEKITFAMPEIDLGQSRNNFFKSYRGSIGGEVLRRFNIIIDYTNETLYLKKNRSYKEGFYYNMAGLKLKEGEEELVTDIEYGYEIGESTETRSLKKIEFDEVKTFVYSYIKKVIVSYVVPGSVADRNGIKEGDQIVGLSNRGLGEFNMGEVTKLFYQNPGSILKLRLKRGDSLYEVRLKLKQIVD